MKATMRAVAVVALIAVSLVSRSSAADAQNGAPSGLSWQSAGDSYSSGEGIFGNAGACAQSADAYGPLAAERLPAGWDVADEVFTACTGHLVEDYFNARTSDGDSLAEWGRTQGGPERTDVITMSFGGNDIGFADIIGNCILGKPDSWGEFLVGGVASSSTGCDESSTELEARIDGLLDPSAGCAGRRHGDAARTLGVAQDGFDCDLALDGRRGSIIDFYFDVVTDRLTERGRLYIVGYPRLFADVEQWPVWSKLTCQMVKRGDTEKLGRLAEYLNNKLQEAVRRANEALGGERVVFVDRFAQYRDGQHELCGRGADWLNGVAVDRGEGLGLRPQASFHPNQAGHSATADQLVERVDATFPRGPERGSSTEACPRGDFPGRTEDPLTLMECFAAAWAADDQEVLGNLFGMQARAELDTLEGGSFEAPVELNPSCWLGSSGAGSCEILYLSEGQTECCALIFRLTYALDGEGDYFGLTIDSFTWQGDAG